MGNRHQQQHQQQQRPNKRLSSPRHHEDDGLRTWNRMHLIFATSFLVRGSSQPAFSTSLSIVCVRV
jgi:hypothetical protein